MAADSLDRAIKQPSDLLIGLGPEELFLLAGPAAPDGRRGYVGPLRDGVESCAAHTRLGEHQGRRRQDLIPRGSSGIGAIGPELLIRR